MLEMKGRRAAQRYFAARRARDRGLSVLRSVTDGLLLGFMSRDALAAVDQVFYERRTEQLGAERRPYTDDGWNLRGLFDWELAAVRTHFRPGGRVLVTGAGGGREVVALLEQGFDAYGFEPNPVLVSAGGRLLSARGYEGRLQLVDRDAAPEADGPWDAVVVGWGSYMLMPGRARRLAFLGALRAQLRPGAVLLVSFWPRSKLPAAGSRARSGAANTVRRLLGREPVEVGDVLAPNFVHTFTAAEIRAELDAAGFDLVEHAEEPFGHAVARAV